MLKKLNILIIIFTILTCNFCMVYAESDDGRFVKSGFVANTFSGVDLKDAQLAMEVLIQSIMDINFPGYGAKNIIFDDTESAIRALNSNEIDILAINTIDYLKNSGSMNIEPCCVLVQEDEVEVEFFLLVQKKKNVDDPAQLKNGKLIVQRGIYGEIALLWLNTILLEKSLPENDSFFLQTKKVEKESQAVLPVFFGQADACVIRRKTFDVMVQLNPQIKNQLVIMSRSPGFLPIITVFRRGLDKSVKDRILNFSRKMPDDEKGKQFLVIFHSKEIVPFKQAYMDNITALFEKYNTLKNKK